MALTVFKGWVIPNTRVSGVSLEKEGVTSSCMLLARRAIRLSSSQ